MEHLWPTMSRVDPGLKDRCKISLMDYFIMMRPDLIAWHETKLAKLQCQRPLVLTKSVFTSAAWALHTLIGWYRECTVDKFLSLVHPFYCVCSTFLPITVHPPTALISHSGGKKFIQ
jgi:hypothetical protein